MIEHAKELREDAHENTEEFRERCLAQFNEIREVLLESLELDGMPEETRQSGLDALRSVEELLELFKLRRANP